MKVWYYIMLFPYSHSNSEYTETSVRLSKTKYRNFWTVSLQEQDHWSLESKECLKEQSWNLKIDKTLFLISASYKNRFDVCFAFLNMCSRQKMFSLLEGSHVIVPGPVIIFTLHGKRNFGDVITLRTLEWADCPV
jgi:hypothetical protein